jgi:hypothetical protein
MGDKKHVHRRAKGFAFSDCKQIIVRKRTEWVRFLTMKVAAVTRRPLLGLIGPHYPKTDSKCRCNAYPLKNALLIYFDEALVLPE